MAIRGHQTRWVVCITIIYYIISCLETSAIPVYSSVTGNGNDPLIVSNEQVYLQLGQTQRIPCRKQTDGTTDVIAATWYEGNNRKEVIRTVSDPIYGENYTSPEYEGRVSFNPNFDLTLKNVIQDDAGRYTCELITDSADNNVDYDVEVTVIDDRLPTHSADRSVSKLLKADENIVDCPVYNKSITRPTIYWSIQRQAGYPTDILVSRFSDGSILHKDSNYDIQHVANYSLVITNPKAVPEELFVWCHVSSDVDGLNLMSGFINATQSKPAELSNLHWIIPLACVGGIIVILLIIVLAFVRHRLSKKPSSSPDNICPIIQGPINTESCKDYRIKEVIHPGGKEKKTCPNCFKPESEEKYFSSLKLVTVAYDGDLVMLDEKAIHVMSRKYNHKETFEKWSSVLKEYVALTPAKGNSGKVLVAKKNGNISWLDIKSGTEAPNIPGSDDPTPSEISDMDVDDMGTIYAADVKENKTYTYQPDGSFKSMFKLNCSPKRISACGDGILYVLAETKGSEVGMQAIKKYRNGSREDYDITFSTNVKYEPTGLYASKTSLFVVSKSDKSAKEASSILEFSATDGQYQRHIIDDWEGILGMVIIREDDELAFFDSKQAKVYKRLKNRGRGKKLTG